MDARRGMRFSVNEKMKRIRNRLAHVTENDGPLLWSGLAGMIIAASPFYISGGLALASGLGPLADVILLCSGIWLSIRICSYIVGLLLAFIPLKLPRQFIGGTLASGAALYVIWNIGKVDWKGSLILSLLTLLIGFAIGSSAYLLCAKRGIQNRMLRSAQMGYAIISFSLLLATILWMSDIFTLTSPAYTAHALSLDEALPIEADNPSTPGNYTFTTFTYGSGNDRQRKAFAEEAAMITPTVDGSAIIKDWDWSRRWLWGYDIHQLPLNGWVWMPDGKGPFPVILIVHGNQSMAEYSDIGYDYLGELLASRGFIVVSVDENFINHSSWEGGLDTLDADMTIRAWLLLQHLIAIEKLNEETGNPFTGKADLDRIAIIGHSRGGQAAVLATDFDRMIVKEDQTAIRVNKKFNIQAVVALAPTDFQVYKQQLIPQDIHYLLLQGASDADVNTFSGDRQYSRIRYSGNENQFKASLYIRGANHGQFNTDWERKDVDYPTQLLLDKNSLLDGNDQRTIAKVYISAFLETVFHERSEYKPIFQDYRYALSWLPETQYVSRYRDADFEPITDYEEGYDKETGRLGVTISVEGEKEWIEDDLKNRRGLTQQNRVLELEWEQAEASYILQLPDSNQLELEEQSALSFALADLSDQPATGVLTSVEITDAEGDTATVSLETYAPVPIPIETKYLKEKVLEPIVQNGRLSISAEPVLQSFVIPFTEFVQSEPAFNPSEITEIRFRFIQDGGRIIMDDIGLYLSPRS